MFTADRDTEPDAADPQPQSSSRGWLACVPASVWLISGLWASLLIGASLLWPMNYGYDEPQHIDMAYVYSAHPLQFYAPGQLLPTLASINAQKQVPGFPPQQRLAVAPIPPRGQRLSFGELGGHTATTGTQPNQMVQHPPLYYWFEAVVLRLPGVSHLAWDMQVWLMRLLSVLFLLPVPILCWATALRILTKIHPIDNASALAALAAAAPLTLPNLVRDGSSVSNDSLLILTTSVMLYLVSRVMTGDLSRRTSVWMGLSLAAALLTKGFALVLPPIILAAYLVGSWRAQPGARSRWRTLWPALVSPVAGGLVGGLWWLRNLVDYGRVQVNGFGADYDVVLFGPPDNHGTISAFLPRFLSDFISRIWGGIGLPDQPSPGPFVVYGWFTVVLVGVLTAVFLRPGHGSRTPSLVLVAAPVLTVAVVAAGSFSAFRQWSDVPRGSQGRYLFHLVVGISALAAVGWLCIVQPRVRPTFTPIVLIAAVVTQLAAWLIVVRSWYQPRNTGWIHGLLDGVHGVLRWSPVPAPVTALLVVVLPPLAAGLAIAHSLRQARLLRAAQPS